MQALAYSLYQDFPFNAAIALFMRADVLQIRGLKDQMIIRLIKIYAEDEFCFASQLWNRRLPDNPGGCRIRSQASTSHGMPYLQDLILIDS